MRSSRRLPVAAAVAALTIALGAAAIPASATTVADSPIDPAPGSCSATAVALAPGVELSCLTDPAGSTGATVAHLATVDLSAGTVAPRTVISNDTVYQSGLDGVTPNEPVSSMVDRTGALLGINGGFFDNDKGPGGGSGTLPEVFSGQICGGLVSDGRIVKSPPADPALNVSLAVHDDGHLSIAPVTFSGRVATGDSRLPLDGINSLGAAATQPSCPKALMRGPVVADGVTLITPDMGEVVLQDSRYGSANSNYVIDDAILVTAVHDPSGAPDSYVVRSAVRSRLTGIPQLLDGEVALLSSWPEAQADQARPADWIVEHLTPGTVFTAGGALSDPTITSLIGAPAPLVENGAPTDLSSYFVPHPTSHNAETLLGIDATGTRVTIMVVDDYPGWSGGVTGSEAQQLMIDAGVETAVLFDGGGSSTLAATLPGGDPDNPCGTGSTVVSVQTGENDYPVGCANQRYVGDALVFVPTGVTPTPTPAPAPAPAPSEPAPTAGPASDAALAATGSPVEGWAGLLGLSAIAISAGLAGLLAARVRGWRAAAASSRPTARPPARRG